MRKSENINELAAALAKAQGAMKPAQFNKINPHFKSRFADLNSCMDACKQPLADNGLCVMQLPEQVEGKDILVTMLAHSSGQWITSEYPLLAARMDSQGFGSAMTYAKRYSLCALLGIVADEDDDGEATMDRSDEKQKQKPKASYIDPVKVEEAKAAPRMSAKQAEELYELGEQCNPHLIEKMKKFMHANFNATSFEMCPVTSYEQFRNSMLKDIELLSKEKAI
jgi:hypothetical protein